MNVRVGMIWAQTTNGVIGRGGDMPWHVPEDLKHFKQATLGAPVIMGRHTWQSLPAAARPLPGRVNIVVSRDPDFTVTDAVLVRSLEDAIARAESHSEPSTEATGQAIDAWIMGGGELYRAGMPFADELVVTQIETEVHDGDTFAPNIDSKWQRVEQSPSLESTSGVRYRFERYTRV